MKWKQAIIRQLWEFPKETEKDRERLLRFNRRSMFIGHLSKTQKQTEEESIVDYRHLK